MRRDLDLVRELLLKLEALPIRPGGVVHITDYETDLPVSGYSAQEIEYHLAQIKSSGFIDDGGLRPMMGIGFRSLTPSGHDYLDAVRDPEVWHKTKDRAGKAGGWTLGLIKDIGVAIIKGELQKHGVPIS